MTINKYKDFSFPTWANFKCECMISFNAETKIIHVLDDYQQGNTSVTNGVQYGQKAILDELGLKGKVEDYTWYLYGTDGVVSNFKHGQFNFVSPVDPSVDPFTLETMRSKYKLLGKHPDAIELRNHPNPIEWLKTQLNNQ